MSRHNERFQQQEQTSGVASSVHQLCEEQHACVRNWYQHHVNFYKTARGMSTMLHEQHEIQLTYSPVVVGLRLR